MYLWSGLCLSQEFNLIFDGVDSYTSVNLIVVIQVRESSMGVGIAHGHWMNRNVGRANLGGKLQLYPIFSLHFVQYGRMFWLQWRKLPIL